ncbi:hypothetical protein [Bradyrhizobium ottawaense]|uniref:hypothetical protein n=1 Tax=Bradyrhizobium ottawaense TaxID=931866 RepID=UPI00384F80DA
MINAMRYHLLPELEKQGYSCSDDGEIDERGTGTVECGSSSAPSEDADQESYLGGFNRAVANLIETLTGYRTPASARAQIVDNWVAEEGQGEAENRRQGRRRIRSSDNTGSHSLDLSSLSLTALPAALPPRLLELRARRNELSSLPAMFPARSPASSH